MKTYWDTSALVAAVGDPALKTRLQSQGGVTRAHSISEMFSALTGNPARRIDPDDATAVIVNIAASLDFVELSAKEMMNALKRAQKCGVRGGRVHDFMHAVAAEKFRAGMILTLDKNDFLGLTCIPIEVV